MNAEVTGTSGMLFVYCLLLALWLISLRRVHSCGCRHGLAPRLGYSCFAFRASPVSLRGLRSCGCSHGLASRSGCLFFVFCSQVLLDRFPKGQKRRAKITPCRFAGPYFGRFCQSEGVYLPTRYIPSALWFLSSCFFGGFLALASGMKMHRFDESF